jgi:hypothetical protein
VLIINSKGFNKKLGIINFETASSYEFSATLDISNRKSELNLVFWIKQNLK